MSASLLRYLVAYNAMRWSQDQPVPLNLEIARALGVSERTIERLARQLAEIDSVDGTPVTRHGCKGWSWDLSEIECPHSQRPDHKDVMAMEGFGNAHESSDDTDRQPAYAQKRADASMPSAQECPPDVHKNVQTGPPCKDVGLDGVDTPPPTPVDRKPDPAGDILDRFDADTGRHSPHPEFREGERSYLEGLRKAGYSWDEIAYGYWWATRHSYVAQQGRQIRSVRIVSPAMIEAAIRWREERERPAWERPHRGPNGHAVERIAERREYRRPSVDYGAAPRADTAVVKRVCAEAKAALKAARGDGATGIGNVRQ